jgi:hypothetical protein
VLQNVGVALVLFPILVLAERAFATLLAQTVQVVRAEVTERVDEVRQEVAAALEQLSEATRDRLQQARDADEEALQHFQDAPNLATLWPLFERAERLAAISNRGLRVRIPGTSQRLRFRRTWQQQNPGLAEAVTSMAKTNPYMTFPVETDQTSFWIEIEKADGTRTGSIQWRADQPADKFATSLAHELARREEYPGDSFYDSGAMFQQLHDTLALAIRTRSGASRLKQQIGPVLETLPTGFVITDRGLYSILDNHEVGGFPVTVLAGSDRPPLIRGEPPKDLLEAWILARALLVSSKQRKMRFGR